MEQSANGREANINQTATYSAGFVHLHLYQTGTKLYPASAKALPECVGIEVQEDPLDIGECLTDVQLMACIPENLSGSIGELGATTGTAGTKCLLILFILAH